MPGNADTAEAVKNNPTLTVVGNPDVWRLICKAHLKPVDGKPGWMKSTKGMETPNGVVLQVTTEHVEAGGAVIACAEALTHIDGATLVAADTVPPTWNIVNA
jgi:hypothetical protein